MRKTIALLLALVMCLTLCACGGKGSNPEGNKEMKLTAEMLSKIENEVKGTYFEKDIVLYETIAHQELGYKFNNFKVTSQRQTSNTTYTVFGIMSVTDEYSKTYNLEANVVYYCQESSDEADGYKTRFYVEYPD